MFRGARKLRNKPDTSEFQFKSDTKTIVLLALEGIGVGLATGLIGVGGGFLIVPALVLVAKLPMRLAIGTGGCYQTMRANRGYADGDS